MDLEVEALFWSVVSCSEREDCEEVGLGRSEVGGVGEVEREEFWLWLWLGIVVVMCCGIEDTGSCFERSGRKLEFEGSSWLGPTAGGNLWSLRSTPLSINCMALAGDWERSALVRLKMPSYR